MAGTTDRTDENLGGDTDDEAFDATPDATPDGHLSAIPVAPRTRGLLLVLGGILGFVAAFTLTVERIKLAENPGYVPSCNISPLISCGSVMVTEQARVFGFPNPLIGIAAFAISGFLGVLVLSRVVLPRWVERGYLVGITLGAVFVAWLISQSLYRIHALCPYCMVVWAVVIPTFWTHLADGLDRGLVPVPQALRGVARVVVDYRGLLIVLSYLAVVAMIATKFWSYWSTLL